MKQANHYTGNNERNSSGGLVRLFRDRNGKHHIVNSDGAWLIVEDGLWSYGFSVHKTDRLLYEDNVDVHRETHSNYPKIVGSYD